MKTIDQIKNLFANAILQNGELSELVLDAGTQIRDKVDANRIEDYREAMSTPEGAKAFPPLKVVSLTEPVNMPDGSVLEVGALILCDGFHRTDSATKAKLKKFQMEVVEGTLEDAKYYAMTANADHGVGLKGKDYQKAIRELYALSPSWREHGKQKEMAALFGCSTKTVERALKVVKGEIKAEAFKMFEAGATDKDVAEFAVIHEKTAGEWRKEWEATKVDSGDTGDNDDKGTDSNDEQPDESNPMDLTFAQVLRLKNPTLKAQLLKLLMDSVKGDSEKQEEPQPEPEQEQPETEEEQPEPVEDDSIAELVKQWKGKTCWQILGKSHTDFAALKNPKQAVKRAYTKLLAKCHSDKYGENEALEMLKDAYAQASKYFK